MGPLAAGYEGYGDALKKRLYGFHCSGTAYRRCQSACNSDANLDGGKKTVRVLPQPVQNMCIELTLLYELLYARSPHGDDRNFRGSKEAIYNNKNQDENYIKQHNYLWNYISSYFHK